MSKQKKGVPFPCKLKTKNLIPSMNLRFFKLVSLLLCLSAPMAISAQVSAPEEYTKEDFIRDFKQGYLLVRLQDKHLTIKSLKENGNEDEIEQIIAKQRRENQEIMLSFSNVFTFCPVYFFYAKDSEAIRKGDFKDKVFDAQLQSVDLNSEKVVFTAEFAETEKLGIEGLIIRDSQMLALKDPLPYFERRYAFFGLIERSKAQMIERYNKKLYKYAEIYGL